MLVNFTSRISDGARSRTFAIWDRRTSGALSAAVFSHLPPSLPPFSISCVSFRAPSTEMGGRAGERATAELSPRADADASAAAAVTSSPTNSVSITSRRHRGFASRSRSPRVAGEKEEEEEEGNRLKDCESHRDWKEEEGGGVDHSWGKRQSRQMFCTLDSILLYISDIS